MKISTLRMVALLSLTIMLFTSIKAYAQPATKDNNILRDPMVMVPGYVAPDNDATQATVITIGDYDNFKLGVDFAECSITSNPLDPRQMYAVWNSTASSGGKGYRTINGFDWTSSNPSWTGMAGDVVVTSDANGKLIYENMYGSISGCKVATSSDYGATWDPVVIAISGNDKNWIAADQSNGSYSNYQYTVMTASGSGNHARSTNGGTTYTNTQNFNTQSLPGMMVAVGPKDALQGGSVYVVTNSGSSFASTYTFYESNDGGASYTYKSAQNFANYVGANVGGRNSVQNMRTRPYPFIAADNSNGPNRGRLYLVYASNFPSGNGNKPDIFCRYSDNGGTTWSSAKTVNDDLNSQNNNNWFPAVWCDKNNGRLFISWMDTRDCPTSDSCLMYATYTDDGITFAPNKAISNKKFKINCTTCGGGGTPAYLGDYNGITSHGLTSAMAWTDFRDGNFGSYMTYFPDYALRAEPAIDTLNPFAVINVVVPSVKLYTDTVFVSASVNAALGMFTVTYPEGNKLFSYPGQLALQISGNNPPAGDYTLNITTTGSNGTPVHKRTATIRVLPSVAPVANFTSNITDPCEGQSVSFTDLSSGPASAWEWSFPGGTPATSTVQNPTGIVYNTAGSYGVTLKVTNIIGTNTLVMENYITAKTTPAAPVAQSLTACFGQPIPDLTATGVGLQWYQGGSVVGTGSPFATGQTAIGVHNYFVTQTDNGCSSSPTAVSLTIRALPAVSLAAFESVCASAPAFDLTGGTPEGGTYSGTGVSNGITFDPSVAGAGDHTLTYSYSDAFGCANSADQNINVKTIPTVSLSALAPVCVNGNPVILTGSPMGGMFSGTGVSGDTLYPSVAGAGDIDVTYTYTDPANGCPGMDMKTITINSLPKAAINDTAVCGNLKVKFDATISNPQSYLWMPGGATTATLQIDTVGRGLGTHVFNLTVTDANGCVATKAANVSFFDCTGINEFVDSKLIELYPNPTTGHFAIRSQAIPTGIYDLKIFDAFGKSVYTEAGLKIENEFMHPLNLTHLSNGIYILQLRNKVTGFSKRFVISK